MKCYCVLSVEAKERMNESWELDHQVGHFSQWLVSLALMDPDSTAGRRWMWGGSRGLVDREIGCMTKDMESY
jgi:hypothetical protein